MRGTKSANGAEKEMDLDQTGTNTYGYVSILKGQAWRTLEI
jgi:hypothetical protein